MDRDGRPSISLKEIRSYQPVMGKRSFWERVKEDPYVPLGCLATAAVLLGGLGSFAVGSSSRLQNHFMKARLVAQGATVLAVMTGTMLATRPEEQDGPKKKIVKYEDRMKIVLSDTDK